uniref:Uncharacterized protein n=1 Tax=Plectus sambesii TaxID=2011161 RepID=A0A914UKL7_9BILA
MPRRLGYRPQEAFCIGHGDGRRGRNVNGPTGLCERFPKRQDEERGVDETLALAATDARRDQRRKVQLLRAPGSATSAPSKPVSGTGRGRVQPRGPIKMREHRKTTPSNIAFANVKAEDHASPARQIIRQFGSDSGQSIDDVAHT